MADPNSNQPHLDPLTGQPIVGGQYVLSGQPVVAGQPMSVGQPVVAGQPAATLDPRTGQPVGTDPHPHKIADDTEQVYFEGSPLMRGVIGKGIAWVFAGVVLIALPLVIYFLRSPHQMMHPWWLNLIFVAIGVLLFFYPVIKAKTVRYRISNYRVDFERGWFSKDIDTLELWHVEDLKFHQSFIDRLMGVGTIIILSHDDTTPQLVLHGIPNPRPIFETLKQRVIAVKRQGGVVKMDVGT